MQYKSRWDIEGGADPCKADGDLETRLTKHKVRSLLAQWFALPLLGHVPQSYSKPTVIGIVFFKGPPTYCLRSICTRVKKETTYSTCCLDFIHPYLTFRQMGIQKHIATSIGLNSPLIAIKNVHPVANKQNDIITNILNTRPGSSARYADRALSTIARVSACAARAVALIQKLSCCLSGVESSIFRPSSWPSRFPSTFKDSWPPTGAERCWSGIAGSWRGLAWQDRLVFWSPLVFQKDVAGTKRLTCYGSWFDSIYCGRLNAASLS